MTNLIEPILFDEYSDAKRMTRHHVCALCGEELYVVFALKRMYGLECPTHGPVYAHSYTQRKTYDKVTANIITGKIEIGKTKPEKPEDIIKKLGF